MTESLEKSLREICNYSAPGTVFGTLEKCLDMFSDFEKGKNFVEELAMDHLEKFSMLIPITNLDQNMNLTFWSIASKYGRIDDGNDSKSRDEKLFKYIDPFLGVNFILKASILEVIDIEKLNEIKDSRLSSFRKELENMFLDKHLLYYKNNEIFKHEVGNDRDFESLDLIDFNTPIRRTIIYDSELLPKISNNNNETLLVIRSSASLKLPSKKTGAWNSEWRFEFTHEKENEELLWLGKVHIHCYCSEGGNSHFVHAKNDIKINIVSKSHTRDQLINNPLLFAKESSKLISNCERKIQQELNEQLIEFKNKRIRKLRRLLPINPAKFNWEEFCTSIKEPLNETIIKSINISN
ncbi:hypothetical protein FG386_003031 [Cryptosporidium ryanae]|uniref:uncharacterized protein n=1 Tax=Cryptosporidium ryanae TaxID=515981 RepID=UPI00351A988E|nr:hypothetical protein FG386_003031 [Cryptosporidium ryanae]